MASSIYFFFAAMQFPKRSLNSQSRKKKVFFILYPSKKKKNLFIPNKFSKLSIQTLLLGDALIRPLKYAFFRSLPSKSLFTMIETPPGLEWMLFSFCSGDESLFSRMALEFFFFFGCPEKASGVSLLLFDQWTRFN